MLLPGVSAPLVDLRGVRDVAALDAAWLAPLRAVRMPEWVVCLASGERALARARDAWKFWRRPPF